MANEIKKIKTFAKLAEVLKKARMFWFAMGNIKIGICPEEFCAVLSDEEVECSKGVIPMAENIVGYCHSANYYFEWRFGIKVYDANGIVVEFTSKCDRKGIYNDQYLLKLEQGEKYFSREEFLELWGALSSRI